MGYTSPMDVMDDSGLPNILMYSSISLLAFTGVVASILTIAGTKSFR